PRLERPTMSKRQKTSTQAPRTAKLAEPPNPEPRAEPPAAPSQIGGIDVAAIRDLATIVNQQGLSELKLRHAGGWLVLRRGQTVMAAPQPAMPPPALHPQVPLAALH